MELSYEEREIVAKRALARVFDLTDKGTGSLSLLCNYRTPKEVNKKTSLYEWRTIHKLDGAFKDLNYDPQNVEIKGSNVTRLPEKYKKNKLGHNWSISWVVDNLMKEIKR